MALLRVIGLALLAPILGATALIVLRWLSEPNRPLFVHALNVLLWLPMKLKLGPFKHSLTIAGVWFGAFCSQLQVRNLLLRGKTSRGSRTCVLAHSFFAYACWVYRVWVWRKIWQAFARLRARDAKRPWPTWATSSSWRAMLL